jgi:DNA-binding NtrC family response regulator
MRLPILFLMASPDTSNDTASRSRVPMIGFLQTRSAAMAQLYAQLDRVAQTLATVLIAGESGVGKEIIAKSIHDRSQRREQVFIPVNCGAIPAGLIEAELFGHEKGSFTGAMQQHIGYFEHASGGTIFLDEITEMAPEMQIKLLRVLETGTFHRVGGTELTKVDVRVIAATNRDPLEAVKQSILREDLLYRLAVFPLRVPPLRERACDIELLAQYFLDQLNLLEKTRKSFSPRSLEIMRTYSWPGNIRELKNTVHRAFIMAETLIEVPSPTTNTSGKRPAREAGCLNLWIGTSLADAQREVILATLDHFNGDKQQTALALGVSLKTLYNRLLSYENNGDPAA